MFRFTIRDVLWLTVVVGMGLSLGVGWWRERSYARKVGGELRLMQEVNRNIFPINEPVRLAPGTTVTVLVSNDGTELTFGFVPQPDTAESN
jgi:hypothetical protein